jgi:hypothetical protein
LVKLIVRQQEKRSSGSEVANFWHCFIAAVRKKRITGTGDRAHFRIEDNVISFYWDEIHAVYLETHREIFAEAGKSSATMRGKMEHHPCWIGPRTSYRIGKRKSSAYAFDMDKSGTSLADLLQEESVTDDLPM